MLRRFHLADEIAGQRQLLGDGQSAAVGTNGIDYIPGLIGDLEHRALQQCPGRQAIGGVVVRRTLCDLDLSGDGGILPFDLSSLAGLHIDGLFLRIPHIALVFHLAQEVASSGQVLKPSVAVVIAGGLCNRCIGAVIEQEGHTGDFLSVYAGNFMDQDAGNGRVIKP